MAVHEWDSFKECSSFSKSKNLKPQYEPLFVFCMQVLYQSCRADLIFQKYTGYPCIK